MAIRYEFGQSFLDVINTEDFYDATLFIYNEKDVKDLKIRPYVFILVSARPLMPMSNIFPIKHTLLFGETVYYWEKYLSMRYKCSYTSAGDVFCVSVYGGKLQIIIQQETADLIGDCKGHEFLLILTGRKKRINGCLEIVYFLERMAAIIFPSRVMINTLQYPMLV
jgi:hypothetical protein